MKKQYDKQAISQVLSKFMAGETTLDEEQQLAEYFCTHEVDEEWREYKQMFALFDSGEVDIETAMVKPIKHASRWFLSGIAASIALLLAMSFGLISLNVDEPEIEKQKYCSLLMDTDGTPLEKCQMYLQEKQKRREQYQNVKQLKQDLYENLH